MMLSSLRRREAALATSEQVVEIRQPRMNPARTVSVAM
jgi:hypothetical protein